MNVCCSYFKLDLWKKCSKPQHVLNSHSFYGETESAQLILERKKRWLYSLTLLCCFFFLLGPMLLLIKSKITVLFQALNSQAAVVSPGSILPSSAVDAIIEVFCYFSPAKFRH